MECEWTFRPARDSHIRIRRKIKFPENEMKNLQSISKYFPSNQFPRDVKWCESLWRFIRWGNFVDGNTTNCERFHLFSSPLAYYSSNSFRHDDIFDLISSTYDHSIQNWIQRIFKCWVNSRKIGQHSAYFCILWTPSKDMEIEFLFTDTTFENEIVENRNELAAMACDSPLEKISEAWI